MNRNHNYTNLIHGQDFILAVYNDAESGLIGDITGQGKIKVGDYITIKFRIVGVEYYSAPTTSWRASLSIWRDINKDDFIAHMTGKGNIKVGNYITIKFRVDEVEHYSDPPDMWRAKLLIEREQNKD